MRPAPPWHRHTSDQARATRNADGHGLASGQAAQRLDRHGPNRLPPLQQVAVAERTFAVGGTGYAPSGFGAIAEARTIAVNTLVAMEIFYLFSGRYLRTPSFTFTGIKGTRPVLIAVTAMFGLQLLFTCAPFMAALSGSVPISPATGMRTAAVGFALPYRLENEKFLRSRVIGSTRNLTQGTLS